MARYARHVFVYYRILINQILVCTVSLYDELWGPGLIHANDCAKGAIEEYENKKIKKKHVAFQAVECTEDVEAERAVEQLIRTERVQGSVKEWMPGYKAELQAEISILENNGFKN